MDIFSGKVREKFFCVPPKLGARSPPMPSCIASIVLPLHHTCHPWLRYALLPSPEDSDQPHVGNLHKSEVCNRAFSVTGPREWNSLPASGRQCTSVAQF